MRYFSPTRLALAGLVLLAAGIVVLYTTSAGIPFQDPTPEQYERWKLANQITVSLFVSGVCLAVLGSLMALTRALRRKKG